MWFQAPFRLRPDMDLNLGVLKSGSDGIGDFRLTSGCFGPLQPSFSHRALS